MVKDERDTSTHPLDSPLLSSPRDFETFIESNIVWKDIVQAAKDRIAILIEDLVAADDEKMIYRLQNQIQVWKELVALPYYLMEHAKIEQTVKEDDYAKNQNTPA